MATERASGIDKAILEFVNYRIVKLNFECGSVVTVTPAGIPQDSHLNVRTGVSDVMYIAEDDVYVVPVSAELVVMPAGEEGDDPVFSARADISGIFRFQDGAELTENVRNRLVLNNTVVILMPFLRAAISSVIAMAGFGAIPFPLLNMARIGENSPRKIIKVKRAAVSE